MLALSKFTGNISGEVIVAISTAVLLLSLTIVSSRNQTIVNIVSKFSGFSYSLYLFHFSFIAFYWFVLAAPVQFQPSILAYTHAFVLLMVYLAFGSLALKSLIYAFFGFFVCRILGINEATEVVDFMKWQASHYLNKSKD